MAQSVLDTPIGPLFIVTSEQGIRYLGFGAEPRKPVVSDGSEVPGGRAAELLDRAASQLQEYFDGERRQFDLPLDLTGTPFQRRVWNVIAEIPFGQTATYAQVALAAQAPNAYRAAGSACALNPVVIVVPCHRVVGSDRGLHGFGGGLDTKVWLLQHEGALPTLSGSRAKIPSKSTALPLV